MSQLINAIAVIDSHYSYCSRRRKHVKDPLGLNVHAEKKYPFPHDCSTCLVLTTFGQLKLVQMFK